MSPPSEPAGKAGDAEGSGLSRQFYLLFIAGLLSDIGTFASQTALFLHVYKLSGHNASYVGLMAMAELVPIVLLSPLGGLFAERYDRKRILIGNDLVRAPLILLMMVSNRPAVLIGLQWLVSASTALFMPSRQSILPDLVPESRIQFANSLVSGVASFVHVLGPVLGALLYAWTRTLTPVLAIDAGSYLCSAALLLALKPRPFTGASEHGGFFAELVGGLRYVRGELDLRLVLLMSLLAGMASGLSTPLFRPFADEVLHGDDRFYSYMLTAFGLGGILGPLLGYRLGKRLGLGRALILLFVGDAVLMLLWSRVGISWLSLVLILLWGLNEFAIIPCHTSYIHQFAKKELMGRTFALFEFTECMPQILAAVLISVVGNRWSTQSMLTWDAILYCGVLLVSLLGPGGRLLRSRRGQPELMSAAED